jgi:hypothetical protein
MPCRPVSKRRNLAQSPSCWNGKHKSRNATRCSLVFAPAVLTPSRTPAPETCCDSLVVCVTLPVCDRDMGPGLTSSRKAPSEAFAVGCGESLGCTLAWLAHDKGDWSGTERPSTLFEHQITLATQHHHRPYSSPSSNSVSSPMRHRAGICTCGESLPQAAAGVASVETVSQTGSFLLVEPHARP